MLDYHYVFMCVILELIRDCSYLAILVYKGYIEENIVVHTITKR